MQQLRDKERIAKENQQLKKKLKNEQFDSVKVFSIQNIGSKSKDRRMQKINRKHQE